MIYSKSKTGRLFRENGCYAVNITIIRYNSSSGRIGIYSTVKWQKYTACIGPTRGKQGSYREGLISSQEVKHRLKKILIKNPHISIEDLASEANCSICSTKRNYMSVRRALTRGKK